MVARYRPDADAISCPGKVRFRSRRDAKARANKIRTEGGGAMHPYQCSNCGLWHLGHAAGYGTGLRHGRGVIPTQRDGSD